MNQNLLLARQAAALAASEMGDVTQGEETSDNEESAASEKSPFHKEHSRIEDGDHDRPKLSLGRLQQKSVSSLEVPLSITNNF